MGAVIQGVGLITVVAAALFLAAAKSAFHETTVAILWCGGWLIYSVGLLISRLNKELTVVPGVKPAREDLDDFSKR